MRMNPMIAASVSILLLGCTPNERLPREPVRTIAIKDQSVDQHVEDYRVCIKETQVVFSKVKDPSCEWGSGGDCDIRHRRYNEAYRSVFVMGYSNCMRERGYFIAPRK